MERNLKIVIATDSFKGSLSSYDAGRAIADGLRKALKNPLIKIVPVADGGEGTTEALCSALSGKITHVNVSDPLGRPINAAYCIAGGSAIMEMSQADGLPLLLPEERDPLLASTFGTGEMIIDAIRRGCREFMIGIGGSATNDGGTGMLEALGYRFIDKDGNSLRGCGASLEMISSIDETGVVPELSQCHFTIACDVDTPFCGPEGAAAVFAPQKGADAEMVVRLERGMESFAKTVRTHCGIRLDDIPGSGAAGGLGGAFLAFLGAELKPGTDMVLEAIGFDDIIKGCDLVMTGEGKMDSQTLLGKTPAGVLRSASRQGIPVVAFCGKLEDIEALEAAGFAGCYETDANGLPLQEAMRPDIAARNLTETVFRVAQTDRFFNIFAE